MECGGKRLSTHTLQEKQRHINAGDLWTGVQVFLTRFGIIKSVSADKELLTHSE